MPGKATSGRGGGRTGSRGRAPSQRQHGGSRATSGCGRTGGQDPQLAGRESPQARALGAPLRADEPQPFWRFPHEVGSAASAWVTPTHRKRGTQTPGRAVPSGPCPLSPPLGSGDKRFAERSGPVDRQGPGGLGSEATPSSCSRRAPAVGPSSHSGGQSSATLRSQRAARARPP